MSNLDVESFVTRHFEDYKYYGNPVEDIIVNCPHCKKRGGKEDTKYHLHISLHQRKQVVHCFRCGYSSTWIGFVRSITGLSYYNALGELYTTPRIRGDMKNTLISMWEPKKEPAYKVVLPEDFESLLKLTVNSHSDLCAFARKYIHNRGFNDSHILQYNLGVAESIGYRVIIPVENDYWEGRALYNWITPKYLNPKNPARDILFNASAFDNYDEVVITEGVFSAMAIGSNAVALIGKECPIEKLARLIEADVEHYIIVLEQNAFPSIQKLADGLIRNNKVVTIWKYKNGDPADKESTFEELEYTAKTRILLRIT